MDLLLILGFSITIILLVIIFLFFRFSQNNSEKSFISLLDSIKQDQIFNNDLIKNDVSEIIKNKLDQEQNIFDLKLTHTSKNIDKNIQEMKELVNKKTDDQKINITQLKTVTELLGKQHKNTEDALHESRKELGKLTGVLSSNQIRGQLGEYLAEDILKQGGFIKNVNYKKSEKIVSSGEIPDFTFMLPQNKKLHMDVKFPFSKFQDLMNSSETEKDRLTREFLRDFKDRIKEITDSRNYINTEDNTLDNALIFIPSDNVLQFIYDNDYSIIEYAHNKKVIVISPMNLLAILGVIREFIETVSISEKNQEFRLMLDSIQKQWAIYKNEHQKLLRQYQTLGNTMRNLSETRINAIDRQFLKMESLKISTSNEIPAISEENESVNIIDELKEEEPVESDYQNLN